MVLAEPVWRKRGDVCTLTAHVGVNASTHIQYMHPYDAQSNSIF